MADTDFIAPSTACAPRNEEKHRFDLRANPTDRLVYRDEFRRIADVGNETLRRWQKEGKLPPFDYAPTRKRQAWLRSTLVANGHFIPEVLERAL